jgi:anti-sigma factor (TIGR02949 family)
VSCQDVERDVDPYIDRELDPDSAAAVRHHIDGCADCRRLVAEREALGRLVRSTPYYPAPDRLRARVAAQAARSAPVRRITFWAAAAALVVSVAGGTMLLRSGAARGDAMVDEVVSGHVRSLMADHLFDVRSTDQHTVKPWFLGKLDFSPPVADLAATGFPLVGGRLDYLAGQPVAALVYQRQKHTINVFVSPERGNALAVIDARSVRGFHVRHWVRDGMSFWAVSDVNDGELTEFVRALQRS